MARRSGRGSGDFRHQIVIDPSPFAIAKVLEGLGDEFKDWRPCWSRVAPIISRGIEDNMMSKGAGIGMGWAQPNASYLRRKAKRWGRIDLVRTRAMLAQIQSATDSIRSISGKHVSVGTDKVYARAVNFGYASGQGGKRHRTGSRWFMGWSSKMQADVEREMSDYAKSLIQKADAKLPKGGA